jgi:AcrR family transcriptional regulator
MKKAQARKALGRPRGFDVNAALDRALKVFWRKGFEGAALSDLTRAMRINKPSLYSAFGNKEALFRKVLDHYSRGPASYVKAALEEPTARAVAERLLRESVKSLTNPRNPSGCLLVQGALSCGDEANPIRRELTKRRHEGEAALRRRFLRAKSELDLPRNSNPGDLARYLVTVLHGMSVEAAGGASRAQLQGVARAALRAWPK